MINLRGKKLATQSVNEENQKVWLTALFGALNGKYLNLK